MWGENQIWNNANEFEWLCDKSDIAIYYLFCKKLKWFTTAIIKTSWNQHSSLKLMFKYPLISTIDWSDGMWLWRFKGQKTCALNNFTHKPHWLIGQLYRIFSCGTWKLSKQSTNGLSSKYIQKYFQQRKLDNHLV